MSGAFIVLEGMDKVGKTTQVQNIVYELKQKGVRCEGISFPNRSTPIGKLLDQYLKKEIKIENKQAVTLLFTANRWECKADIERKLKEGITLICDRYILSGLAYASVNGLGLTWTAPPEVGLPDADLTLYLMKEDGNFVEEKGQKGGEIYETTPFQTKVHQAFMKLVKGDSRVKPIVVDCKDIAVVLMECLKHISPYILFPKQ